MQTIYQIFEVAENATPEQLRAAWVRLVRLYHTDHNSSADPRLCAEINRLYDVVKDPGKRQQYDEWLAAQRCPVQWSLPVFAAWAASSGTTTTISMHNCIVITF